MIKCYIVYIHTVIAWPDWSWSMMLRIHVSAASWSLKKAPSSNLEWTHQVVTPQAFSELSNTAIIMSVYQVTTADGEQLWEWPCIPKDHLPEVCQACTPILMCKMRCWLKCAHWNFNAMLEWVLAQINVHVTEFQCSVCLNPSVCTLKMRRDLYRTDTYIMVALHYFMCSTSLTNL